jgi:hypothetical protein
MRRTKPVVLDSEPAHIMRMQTTWRDIQPRGVNLQADSAQNNA